MVVVFLLFCIWSPIRLSLSSVHLFFVLGIICYKVHYVLLYNSPSQLRRIGQVYHFYATCKLFKRETISDVILFNKSWYDLCTSLTNTEVMASLMRLPMSILWPCQECWLECENCQNVFPHYGQVHVTYTYAK